MYYISYTSPLVANYDFGIASYVELLITILNSHYLSILSNIVDHFEYIRLIPCNFSTV